MKAAGTLNVFVAAADYPTELIMNAGFLVTQAEQARTNNPPDERNIPKANERGLARAAIYTACNCLESLLMDCVQDHIANAPATLPLHTEIEEKIKKRQANISWTFKEWPRKLVNVDVAVDPACAKFEDVFILRNELVHPKLDRYGNIVQRSQDDLIRIVEASKARWVVDEISKMCRVLYTAFGKPVPLNFSNPYS